MSSEKVELGLSQSLLGPQHLPTLVRHTAGFGLLYWVLVFSFFFFWPWCKACGIFITCPGVKTEVQSLNYFTSIKRLLHWVLVIYQALGLTMLGTPMAKIALALPSWSSQPRHRPKQTEGEVERKTGRKKELERQRKKRGAEREKKKQTQSQIRNRGTATTTVVE